MVLSFGLILTTGTQLRFADIPIGLGELTLLAWIATALIGLLLAKYPRMPVKAIPIGSFWFVAIASLTIGVLWSLVSEARSSWQGGAHDFAAIAFSALLSIVFVSVFREPYPLERMLRNYVLLASVIMGSMLGLSLFMPSGLGVYLWYQEKRFTGWATNPNQLALLLAGLPYWALHLRLRAGRKGRALLGFAIIIAILVGVATGSDALILAWTAGFTLLAVTALYERYSRRGRSTSVVYVYLVFACLALTIALVAFGWPILVERLEEGEQGSIRMALWANGLQAIGMSPVFGHGPGAHSGMDLPFQDLEAHSTLIDWGASAGLVGLVAYLSLLWMVCCSAWRARRIALLAGLFSVFVFSLFHYVMRQPVFWSALLIVWLLSNGEHFRERRHRATCAG